MLLLEYIELLTESVSIGEINNAIDTHTRILINYHTKGEDNNTGARIIEVYAYGLTKAGNPVIRAFQPYGDTTSRVSSWKFFRIDRISYWKSTGQKFSRPASEYYKGMGLFNPNGDMTMKVVYKIAKFDGYDNVNDLKPINHSSPKLKTPTQQQIQTSVPYKTDTEKRMERLHQQLINPITLSDIKTKNGFRKYNNDDNKLEYGPKMKPQTQQIPTNSQENNSDVYKTDTERGMEGLRQQLQNPKTIDLTQFSRRNNNIQRQNDTRQEADDLYKTDTERGLENLRQQLKNPRKIDLSKIPRR